MIAVLLWVTVLIVFAPIALWFIIGALVSLGALAILVPVGLLAALFRGTEALSRLLPIHPSWPFLPRK